VFPLRRLARSEREGIEAEADRYGRFLGTPVSLSIG
jgi:hypothetical protein